MKRAAIAWMCSIGLPTIVAAQAPPPDDGSTATTASPAPAAAAPSSILSEIELHPFVEVRSRFESRIDPYTSATGADLSFITMRSRVGLDAKWRFLRVYVQAQDARDFGAAGPSASPSATTDIHQGYVELSHALGYLRVGRQEISLGRQRMIGAVNWASAARSFDAIRLHGKWGDVQLDVFGSWVNRRRTLASTTIQTEGDFLAGAHLEWKADDAFSFSPYVLFRHDGPTESTSSDPMDPAFVERERNIAALGLRAHGVIGDFKYDLEGIAEVGNANDEEFLAFAGLGDLSYVISASPFLPLFGAGFSYATGASSKAGVDTFDRFYPTPHALFGSADMMGLSNQAHAYGRIGFSPTTKFTSTFDAHALFLAEPDQAWVNAFGGNLGVAASNTDRFLGTELDLELAYLGVDHLQFHGGYAVFLPANGAKALGHHEPTHWMYLSIGAALP